MNPRILICSMVILEESIGDEDLAWLRSSPGVGGKCWDWLIFSSLEEDGADVLEDELGGEKLKLNSETLEFI